MPIQALLLCRLGWFRPLRREVDGEYSGYVRVRRGLLSGPETWLTPIMCRWEPAQGGGVEPTACVEGWERLFASLCWRWSF